MCELAEGFEVRKDSGGSAAPHRLPIQMRLIMVGVPGYLLWAFTRGVPERIHFGTSLSPNGHSNISMTQQQALPYDPRGVLHLAAQVTLAGEGGGYHLDSMAASETVKLADRILTDHRSELRDEAAMADLVQLLDMFAKVGWPDALALLWRLDEVFR